MKHTYENYIDYLKQNDDENTMFVEEIKALENDTYIESLIQLIEDEFNDEVVLHDHSTAEIKDMFVYYTKHHK